MTITRRALGAGTAALALPGCARDEGAPMPALQSRQFPADFVWGVASSAFQIEGALAEGGRGPSIWDDFPREAVADGSDGSVAIDSYHRYGEDVALIADAGLNAYRFSIAWPRIFPEGAGPVNEAGVDYYSRLVDALLEHGIAPYATLFHWDLPQALQDQGGWTRRQSTENFRDYAVLIAERLGDRLKHFVVMNEAAVHAVVGHVLGLHAPKLTGAGQLGRVIHHLNLAQGMAIMDMRLARPDASIGTTLALMPSRPKQGVFDMLDRVAADGFDKLWNGGFLDPLLRGSYPKVAADMIGDALRPGDIALTKQRIDFLGVNYYAPSYMRFDASRPSYIAPADPPRGVELDAFGRHVDPGGLHETLLRLKNEYDNPRVLITENGCSDAFSTGPAVIEDDFRIAYVRRHLEAVKAAMEAGCDIGGYFHWTLIDNWEWAEGYRSKFGLVAHNRETGVRTPKASYAWFSALARSGALPE